MKFKKNTYSLILCLSVFLQLQAQSYWSWNVTDFDHEKTDQYLNSYQIAQLNAVLLESQLTYVPSDEDVQLRGQKPVIIELPMPSSTLKTFEITQSVAMSPVLAKKYPNIQTYKGYEQGNPTNIVRLEWALGRLHVYIPNGDNAIFIEPLEEKDKYVIFEDVALKAQDEAVCGMHDHDEPTSISSTEKNGTTGEELRVLRAAFACTGEYAQYHGGTLEDGMSAVVTMVNRLNAVFERDLTLRFELVDDNDALIFTAPGSDPYENDNFSQILRSNPVVLNDQIGFDNYDIGHVLTTADFGVAGVASFVGNFCTQAKGSAVSGLIPSIQARYINTLAHELGHQLGAGHTWNNCGEDNNLSQRSPLSAVEPGSGSTIMSYAGSCGEHNVVGQAFTYFHSFSINQINNHLRASDNCYVIQSTGNTKPTVVEFPTNGLFIPIRTPFEMVATATDAEDDNLLYAWDQINRGAVTPLGEPEGNGPSFASFRPDEESIRIIPRRASLVLNLDKPDEVLPTYNRLLTFNFAVRDQNPNGGGVTMRELNFNATESAGPFQILEPGDSILEWRAGEQVEVTWDVANTDVAPVNCTEVNIWLSYNNALTFDKLLAERVPNTGSAFVTVPDSLTRRARLKIKAADNIFFDWSDTFFKIIEGTTDVTDLPAHNDLQIFPNPVRDQLTIQFGQQPSNDTSVEIWDMTGRLLYSDQLQERNSTIDLSTLTPGLYYVEILDAQQRTIRKIVVE